jgi:soluble lytic murein transglycosylase
MHEGVFRMPLRMRRARRLLTCAALIGLASGAAPAQDASDAGSTPSPAGVTSSSATPSASPEAASVASPSAALLAASPDLSSDGPADDAVAATDGRPGLDLKVLREAIDLYRKGDLAGGDRVRAGLSDPASVALTEWLAIRHGGAAVGFNRLMEFVRSHPTWPVTATLRRRAEELLLVERKPAAVVRAYFATQRPITATGKLALALAFKADGLDRDAAALVRETWRRDVLGRDLEKRLLEAFPGVLTQADHRFRMERFLFKENWETALRAAAHAGKDYASLVKARQAVVRKAGDAAKMLDAVPASLREDTSYLFSRAQHLRRNEKAEDAARLIANVTRDGSVLADGDEWWTERRLIARKLLDQGDAKAAYLVVFDHAAETAADRIEAEFHAGWIALRFLKQPDVAAVHFAEAAKSAATPISLARVAYWQGRAAEAAGQPDEARRHYETATRQPITYYGQLASAKLGVQSLPLRVVNVDTAVRAEFDSHMGAQALKRLYAVDARDLALPLYIDLAQRLTDPTQLNALGDLAVENRDSRGLLAVGKTAVQRGFPLDLHAFPTIGIPAFEPVGDQVETAMVFAIARQESAFDPRAQSHAGARGLMQLMPATAKRTAQRFGVDFNLDRLLSDASYNAKIGAAHLGELMEDWKGSLILTFASYNAGGGNVKKWIDAYGDPRSPHVDPIDWVERIPFSETRNYVQRVMENLQVYRSRLGERRALLTEGDWRGKRAIP